MIKRKSRAAINYIKKIIIVGIVCLTSVVGTVNASASTKNIEVMVNKTKTISVKKTSVKVKWTIKNKKIVKIVKIKGKKNNILKIKGIKKGKTKIVARYKNKKYIFKVNVVNKNNKKTNNETKIDVSYVNDKITLKDNLVVKYKLINGEGTISLDYKTEKLEKYIDGEWKNINKKKEYQDMNYVVNGSEMTRNADLNNYYDISTGQYRLTNKVNGQECIVNFNVYENDTKFVGILKNNQINMNDELSFYVYAVGNEDNTYPGSLQPGKLEIYEDNQWKNIELSDDARFPEIIILIENLRPGYFSIPIFQDYVGLHSGHYRYIHTIEGINIPMEFDVL